MNRYSTLKTKTPLRAKKAWNSVRKPMSHGTGFKNTGSTLKSHTGLKTRTTLKATKPMNKIGKVGKANIKANKIIRAYSEKHNLESCELKFKGCLGKFTMANAHRHKRAFYKGDPELLSDPKQWVKACTPCHDRIEHNEALTKSEFSRLRGPE